VRRRYRPDWELLADAIRRIQNTNGVTEDEAKADFCRALNDGKIELKIQIAAGASMEGEHVFRPPPGLRLDRTRFDWRRSTPLPPTISAYRVPDQPVEAMMVSTADVVEHLCGGVSAEDSSERPAQDSQPRPAPQQKVDKMAEMGLSIHPRYLSKQNAKKFVASYIEEERKAGRRPTMVGRRPDGRVYQAEPYRRLHDRPAGVVP
jgi:hypothetical protein